MSIDETVTYLKAKFGEYQRHNQAILEKQTQTILDNLFAEFNGTNIRKQFYKKKDLIKLDEEQEEKKPIIDSYGEELIEHKTQNTLNNMLPVIVKTEEANKLLAKRSREPEQGEDSGAPEKRKRIGNG